MEITGSIQRLRVKLSLETAGNWDALASIAFLVHSLSEFHLLPPLCQQLLQSLLLRKETSNQNIVYI